jgi:hypothetical protein
VIHAPWKTAVRLSKRAANGSGEASKIWRSDLFGAGGVARGRSAVKFDEVRVNRGETLASKI